jgi:hypothetical protein
VTSNVKVAIVIVLSAIGLIWALSPAANASTLPKISANTNGWHGQVRPDHVFIGQGSAPEVLNLRWNHYGVFTAESTGTVLWPSSSARPRFVRVDVWRPRGHAGVPGKFFTRMNWTFRSTTGNLRTIHFVFVPLSSSFPFWEQR